MSSPGNNPDTGTYHFSYPARTKPPSLTTSANTASTEGSLGSRVGLERKRSRDLLNDLRAMSVRDNASAQQSNSSTDVRSPRDEEERSSDPSRSITKHTSIDISSAPRGPSKTGPSATPWDDQSSTTAGRGEEGYECTVSSATKGEASQNSIARKVSGYLTGR
ncbi:uncharacterized protein I303_102101 [Kwoniella dejecticola CBS 10117]|uniref:Uncharacterized protein n=1 Tax=Kwoniella dejecticola CBS 10117 TaxID=1296121 RepID=A0A1A6ABX2_9TREE|nr:uncharacterized protein I303_01758 [Kwoniella dejecticola CBS 10117]OBR87550.1 hypothetical protein I303_01758 [Kwoniella dejecticola CBS 10117]